MTILGLCRSLSLRRVLIRLLLLLILRLRAVHLLGVILIWRDVDSLLLWVEVLERGRLLDLRRHDLLLLRNLLVLLLLRVKPLLGTCHHRISKTLSGIDRLLGYHSWLNLTHLRLHPLLLEPGQVSRDVVECLFREVVKVLLVHGLLKGEQLAGPPVVQQSEDHLQD